MRYLEAGKNGLATWKGKPVERVIKKCDMTEDEKKLKIWEFSKKDKNFENMKTEPKKLYERNLKLT